jgi:hypothetical protein
MPVNSEETYKTWLRYAWVRDNGHTQYVEKALKCERFFAGDQWDAADRAALEAVRRPVLTINKILSTMSNVMGEQIQNRAEISFRPRADSSAATADILNKVFKQISDNNQLAWKRSDMFADGVITSRGFLDVRIEYKDSMQGEVVINNLNAKNIMVDPDAEEYDPDTWSEVFHTKWMTADDIAVLYGKANAELLRNKDRSSFPYGYDSIQMNRDRFGYSQYPMYSGNYDNSSVLRNIRVVERQYRKLDRQQHFLSPETGDMRPIPEEFDRNRIAMFVEKFGFQVVPKLVRRIYWYVMADNVELHAEWSPYDHFTVVPFFPHFRRGHTYGLVENLLGPQELLNKVTSQELHVVNTTANSGYKVKAGALSNMTPEELEQKGAQTGLVIEVNGDPDKDVQKISPNQVPQGLDRISYKAEESIKTISGVSDSMQGMDRADVAAKAIQQKRQAGSTNLVKPLDNLTRSDYILARIVLNLVQEYYTDKRMMTITKDQATGQTETFEINGENEYGEITNDLTLGEYDVIVTSVPAKDTLEDSQFEQAVSMRELGVQLPDSVLIDASRLQNKKEIIAQMQEASQSPEAQQQKQLQLRGQAAEVSKTEADAQHKQADSVLKQAKTQETQVQTQILAKGEPDDGAAQAKMAEVHIKGAQAEHKMTLEERLAEHKMQLAEREHQLEREKVAGDQQLKAQDMEQKRLDARDQAVREAAMAAEKPPAGGKNFSRQPTST